MTSPQFSFLLHSSSTSSCFFIAKHTRSSPVLIYSMSPSSLPCGSLGISWIPASATLSSQGSHHCPCPCPPAAPLWRCWPWAEPCSGGWRPVRGVECLGLRGCSLCSMGHWSAGAPDRSTTAPVLETSWSHTRQRTSRGIRSLPSQRAARSASACGRSYRNGSSSGLLHPGNDQTGTPAGKRYPFVSTHAKTLWTFPVAANCMNCI